MIFGRHEMINIDGYYVYIKSYLIRKIEKVIQKTKFLNTSN